jgi:hypothetical protein
MAKIRDFIYLDVERLYSFYSQVFEGVADHYVQSYIDAHQSEDSRKGLFLLGESDLETKLVEVSRRTENKFLYDHMYNRLEDRIRPAIVEASSLTYADLSSIIANAFIVKVSGDAEIEDFDRIKDVMERFNFLGEALGYMSDYSSNAEQARADEKSLDQLKVRVENARDNNQRAKAQAQLENALN